MPNVFELQVELNGWNGGPGINTWHFTSGGLDAWRVVEDTVNGLQAAYTNWKPVYAMGVSWNGLGFVKELDEVTGNLIALHAYDADDLKGTGPATGADSNTSRASMIKVQLVTDQIRNNRVLQGGPFIGPIAEAGIDGNGNVSSTYRQAIPNGLSGLISGIGPRLAVWGRPGDAGPGKVGDVQVVRVMERIAVLRSRRD